jgi:hypothetical protein
MKLQVQTDQADDLSVEQRQLVVHIGILQICGVAGAKGLQVELALFQLTDKRVNRIGIV